jgi:predicted P-loop ATPase
VPLGNLRNVLFALRHAAKWRGVLAYDAFAARVITQKPPPWGDQTVACENRVHPVRDYLQRLNWDGTPRLDTG